MSNLTKPLKTQGMFNGCIWGGVKDYNKKHVPLAQPLQRGQGGC